MHVAFMWLIAFRRFAFPFAARTPLFAIKHFVCDVFFRSFFLFQFRMAKRVSQLLLLRSCDYTAWKKCEKANEKPNENKRRESSRLKSVRHFTIAITIQHAFRIATQKWEPFSFLFCNNVAAFCRTVSLSANKPSSGRRENVVQVVLTNDGDFRGTQQKSENRNEGKTKKVPKCVWLVDSRSEYCARCTLNTWIPIILSSYASFKFE